MGSFSRTLPAQVHPHQYYHRGCGYSRERGPVVTDDIVVMPHPLAFARLGISERRELSSTKDGGQGSGGIRVRRGVPGKFTQRVNTELDLKPDTGEDLVGNGNILFHLS